jgi:hypothetical protein
MTPAAKFLILGMLIVAVSSFTYNGSFLTFNTSASSRLVSTSIATNLDTPFTIYSPFLFDTQGSTVTVTPDAVQGKLTFEPVFSEDSSRLYNELYDGEYWYAFKKAVDPETTDATASFALTKITINGQTSNFVLPLFSLPLSFLNLDNLYRCDDVLISYHNTG